MSEHVRATLYTRPGCHLCEEMKAEIARARPAVALELAEVDVDGDPALAERYGRSIPVLEVGGRPLFKGRLTARALERKLAELPGRRASEP